MGVFHDGDVWDIFAKSLPIEKALPVATILTIPAAGSESSPSAVITNWATKRKYGYSSELLRPVFSITNPEICFSLLEIRWLMA